MMKKIMSETAKKYLSAIVMLVVLCGLAGAGRAKISHDESDLGIPTTSPVGHEPLRADVVNTKLANFTLDIQQFANIGTSEEAPTYAVYTKGTLPATCGDFSNTEITYWQPSKYKRTFDLRRHKDVVKALDEYGCIIVRNNQSRSIENAS